MINLVHAKVSQADKSKKVDLSYKLSDLQFFNLKSSNTLLFVFIYTFLCNRNHPKRKEEMEQQIPFSYVIISPENATEKEGYMISTIDKCGFFFARKEKWKLP